MQTVAYFLLQTVEMCAKIIENFNRCCMLSKPYSHTTHIFTEVQCFPGWGPRQNQLCPDQRSTYDKGVMLSKINGLKASKNARKSENQVIYSALSTDYSFKLQPSKLKTETHIKMSNAKNKKRNVEYSVFTVVFKTFTSCVVESSWAKKIFMPYNPENIIFSQKFFPVHFLSLRKAL